MGEQMLNVALGWELYVRTHSALALGFVGLALVLPIVLLSLPAGQLIDRLNRKRVLLVSWCMLAICALALSLLSASHGPVPLFYVCIACMGAAFAFTAPAATALLAQIVPESAFSNAATWESSTFELAAVIGPVVGGTVIALQGYATTVYVLFALACALNVTMLAWIRERARPPSTERLTLRALFSGVRFLGQTQVLLAAITLDMFAVLLGGATTLLPIFALDILHVGATGLGILRAGTAIGAVVMALTLAHRPPLRRAGRSLLFAVAGFGLATIVFGLSRWFPLSLAMLVLLGALDNISVVIRSTLLLTRTPNDLLGRISAIDNVFVGTSNELGGFESGLTAALFGPVASVVLGGIGTVLVVLGVAAIWPEMRRLGRLDGSAERRALDTETDIELPFGTPDYGPNVTAEATEECRSAGE